MAKVTAVIDIGSNSARMAIFEKTSRFGFRLIYEVKSRVRISEGTYENDGNLQPLPMQRAISALKDFNAIAKKYKARKLLCVATSAIRDAPNKKEFLLKAKKESGVAIKVIEGEKEAWFGGIACANLSHKKDGVTIDIGGGSTECAIIKDGKVLDLISLKLGTIRLKELFFDHNKDLDSAKAFIQKELEKLPAKFNAQNIFGIGGTIRAIAKMNAKKNSYPIKTIHGYELDVKKSKDFIQALYESKAENLANLGVPLDRRDNIRPGALIFSMLLEHFGAKTITTSGVGVREGVFLSDMLRSQNFRFPKTALPSLISLKDRFCVNEKSSKLVAKNALLIYDALESKHNLKGEYRDLLKIASMLCDIGSFLNFYGRSDHGAYFLLHGLDYGFSHTQRAIVCLLVEYAGSSIPLDDDIAHISEIMPELITLQWLSFMLSLARTLSLTNVSDLSFKVVDSSLCIESKSDLYLAQDLCFSLSAPCELALNFSRK